MQYLHKEILSFEKKLDVVDAAQVTDDTYCRQYLEHILQHRKFYLRIYAAVLKRLREHLSLPVQQWSLVDYGAGNGLLGLFARYCGVGKVFINDRNDVFVQAAEKLSGILDIDIDGFITGDITAVVQQLQHSPPNIVAGTDVIEHIYDLQAFFSSLYQLNPQMITVFTTASNTDNPLKNRQLQQLQRKDEYQGGSPEDDALYSNIAAAAFVVIREQIIKNTAHQLTPDETVLLVKHTRGMWKDDIEKTVQQYMLDQQLPPLPAHPTNTCDPITGSWTERLLTRNEYIEIYNTAGFNCTFSNGFYNAWCGGVKGVVMQTANAGIKVFGKYLAPFITITGTPK